MPTSIKLGREFLPAQERTVVQKSYRSGSERPLADDLEKRRDGGIVVGRQMRGI